MLELRELTKDDKDRLFKWRNSEDVARHMYTDHLITLEEHERWFARIADDQTSRYWIIALDGEPVGLANIVGIDREARRCTWAFYLASEKVRGRGVGSWVEFQVLSVVFGDLGLHKLCCEVLESNEAVIRLHESFGFRREGFLRDHVWRSGQARNVVSLGLLASEWAQIKPAMEERLTTKGLL